LLITQQYRAQNAELHKDRADYGTSGKKWAQVVHMLMQEHGCVSVLDYGCGKRTLEKALGFPIHNYDPCIEGLDAEPKPADLVCCTDVLEHIEPRCIDDVLDDIKRCTGKLTLLTVATVPAKKTLPDGRNAHILLRPVKWWLPELMNRWDLIAFQDLGPEFMAVMR
jgi:hypothetical protein